MSRMFAAVYCDTSINFPYPDSIEYVGSSDSDTVEELKDALDTFRAATMGLDDPVKVIVGKSETIVRGFFAVESEDDDNDDQYYAIDVEYVYDWQSPMMTILRPFDNENYSWDADNFDGGKYIKNHIDSIHIDEATKVDESKDAMYMLVKSVYRTFNDEVIHQALIKKISANRSDLEYEIYNDLEKIKKINPQSEEFRNESDTKVGLRVYGLRNDKTEIMIIYRIIKAVDDEMIISQSISDPAEIVAAGNYETKTSIKIFTKPFKTSININEIAQGVRDLLGGDINDSDVKAILDCFGFEIDGQFIPLTAKPDGEEQTGMSSDEFKSKYSDILK